MKLKEQIVCTYIVMGVTVGVLTVQNYDITLPSYLSGNIVIYPGGR